MKTKKPVCAANFITAIRIICSIGLLFLPAFSRSFWALYLLAGLSDMMDGTVARKTGSASAFGGRFDTAADFLFVVCCAVKLLSAITPPRWILIWAGIIALIKVGNLLFSVIRRKEMASIHSVPNKLAGAALFLIPLTMPKFPLSAVFVCVLATFASLHETVQIKTLP